MPKVPPGYIPWILDDAARIAEAVNGESRAARVARLAVRPLRPAVYRSLLPRRNRAAIVEQWFHLLE